MTRGIEVSQQRDKSNAPPQVFTDEQRRAIQDEICERISEGETLSEICRSEGMPKRRTVYDWLRQDDEFAKAMDIARDLGADAIADQALVIADTTEEGVQVEIGDDGGTKEKRGDMLGHRKLRVETRLKLLAKWHPKKYGDRMDLNHGGQSGNPVVVVRDLTGRKPESEDGE